MRKSSPARADCCRRPPRPIPARAQVPAASRLVPVRGREGTGNQPGQAVARRCCFLPAPAATSSGDAGATRCPQLFRRRRRHDCVGSHGSISTGSSLVCSVRTSGTSGAGRLFADGRRRVSPSRIVGRSAAAMASAKTLQPSQALTSNAWCDRLRRCLTCPRYERTVDQRIGRTRDIALVARPPRLVAGGRTWSGPPASLVRSSACGAQFRVYGERSVDRLHRSRL